MTILQTILAAVGWQTRVNENFRSVSPAGLYGIDPATTTGLTLGYLGGEFSGVSVPSGTVTLTASATNYVVAHRTTGVVTAATNTTNWANTATYLKLFQFTVGAASFDANEAGADKRQAIGGSGGGGGGDVVGPASATDDRVVTFDGATGKLIKDSGTLLSELAPIASPAFTGSATADDITFSGLALTAASAVGGAGLRLPHGTAPTTPTNGDVWTTTTGIYAQINGSTVGPFGAGGGGGMSNPMTTAGDIIYGGTPSAGVAPPTRLAAGTDGHVLTLASGLPTWAAAAGGGFTGGALTSALDEAKGADIARATTTNIGAATGNFIHLTGTTTVTGLGTVQAGTRRIVRFAGAGTLTHNATSLILPGAANITTAANDTAIFVSEGSGNWRCIAYTRASGLPIVNPTVATPSSLTNWTGSLNTASPNNTVNAARLQVTGGTTNGAAVVQPKGTGPFQLQLADATSTGGDARGTSAVDLQMSRGSSDQVASGPSSAVLGGGSNKATANNSVTVGGNSNTCSGDNALAAGGSNTASGDTAFVWGFANVASGAYATSYGFGTVADAAQSTAWGRHARTRGISSVEAFSSGQKSSPGDVQGMRLHVSVTTADATVTPMTSGGGGAAATNQIVVPAETVVTIHAVVVAKVVTGSDAKGWIVSGVAKNIGGTISMVGSPIVTATGADGGASGWNVSITADNVNGCVSINAIGQAATNITWSAVVTAAAVNV